MLIMHHSPEEGSDLTKAIKKASYLFFLTVFSLEEKKSTLSSRRRLLNFSGLRFTSLSMYPLGFHHPPIV